MSPTGLEPITEIGFCTNATWICTGNWTLMGKVGDGRHNLLPSRLQVSYHFHVCFALLSAIHSVATVNLTGASQKWEAKPKEL
jgi:hypothetical protein